MQHDTAVSTAVPKTAARDQAAKISRIDEEALELMRKLRTHTYCAELGDSPRCVAMLAMRNAIDRLAEVITGDREHFYAKPHSLAQGRAGSVAKD